MKSNNYLTKAIDAYQRNNIGECFESLDYAESALDTNDNRGSAMVLHLRAKISHYDLQNYEEASSYYESALRADINYIPTYYSFADLLIQKEDYKFALETIRTGLSIKGISKPSLFHRMGQAYEKQRKFTEAIEAYKNARDLTIYDGFTTKMMNEIKRVKKKIKRTNKQNKKE